MLCEIRIRARVEHAMQVPATYMFELSRTLAEAWNVPPGSQQVRPLHFRPFVRYAEGKTWELRPDREGLVAFIADEFYELRISTLEHELSQRVMEFDFGEKVEVLGASFHIDSLERELVDSTLWYTQAIGAPVAQSSIARLSFMTPTSFQAQGSYLPLPVPNLLFRSWIQRWDAFEPVVFGEGSAASINRWIVVQPRTLHGVTWRAGGARIPAFMGSVELRLLPGADEIARVLFSVLTRYAPYCGTGVKTALGMGATEAIV